MNNKSHRKKHHYHGTEALDVCAQECNISSESKIINVGSGIGGPARFVKGLIRFILRRYFAGKFVGCQVLAVELQDELHKAATELTERCGLNNAVHHMAGDFLSVGQHVKENAYDCIVSWLTVLHFVDKEKLFKLVRNFLVSYLVPVVLFVVKTWRPLLCRRFFQTWSIH